MNPPDDLAASHRAAWDLIPWLVNGRLSGTERASVEQHLEGCADCRGELEFQRRLCEAVQVDGALATEVEPAFERLLERIEQDGDAAGNVVALRVAAVPLQRLLVAAVIVEAIGLSLLGTVLWRQQAASPAVYRSLSAAPQAPPQARIRLVPVPDLPLVKFQSLLQRTQLQIVSGPTEAGVYSLAPRANLHASVAATLEQLRNDPAVRFAEPVNGAAEQTP